MDDYMFNIHVNGCKYVPEATSYLEIFNYSVGTSINHASADFILILIKWSQDPALNSVEEHPLTPDEFENFLNQRVCRPTLLTNY